LLGQREENGKTIHEFRNKLQKVPSKIFAGKLGDVALRFGRYKLVRFNPPKDFRTGPNRQHLTRHTPDEGSKWLNAPWDERYVLSNFCLKLIFTFL